jgi:phosphate transport system protein
MERRFDEELKDIKKDILKIGASAEEAIQKAVNALKNQDKSEAQEVIDNDKNIDELELVIEDKFINFLSRYQPQASDLRFITHVAKINTNLERIADIAVDIAERVLELVDQPLLKPLIDIPRLVSIAQRMVKEAIDSFVNSDVDLAKKVVLSDPEADDLLDAVQRELIYDYMVKDGTTAPRAVPLLLVARHLERICDHATYIAEDVIYMVQAEVVKHHLEKLKSDE